MEHYHATICQPDVRKFFSYINGKLKGGFSDAVISVNGEAVSDSKKAALFCNQFSSVFTVDNGVNGVLHNRIFTNMLSYAVFSTDNVSAAMCRLQRKTSCGSDGLPSVVFKNCAIALAEPLKLIFERSFETGEIPQIWRDAVVVPIYKNKGSKSDVANYRPISLTSVDLWSQF